MNGKLSIGLSFAMLVIVALGVIGPVYAETLKDVHAAKGITIPESPTKDDCLGCHSKILEGGETSSVEAFHIRHVDSLSMDCTKCHNADVALPELKPHVSEDACIGCHGPGGPGRLIYEGEAQAATPETTATTPVGTSTGEESEEDQDEEKEPGFEVVFAVSGLLAVAYLVRKQRK